MEEVGLTFYPPTRGTLEVGGVNIIKNVLENPRIGIKLEFFTKLIFYINCFVVVFIIGTEEHGHSHGGCSANDHSDITKSLLYGGNMGHHHAPHIQQHQEHHHHEHADHSHQPGLATTTTTAPTRFEQELEILRAASRDLLSSIKKNT